MKAITKHLIPWCLALGILLMSIPVLHAQTVDNTGLFTAIKSTSTDTILFVNLIFYNVDADGTYDASFALSAGGISGWEDYSASVAFYSDGIKVRDNDGFTYTTLVTFEPGVPVDFWFDIDVGNLTYNTWVRTGNMTEPALIHPDAGFRRMDIDSICRWSALHNQAAEPDTLSVKDVELVDGIGAYPASFQVAELAELILDTGSLDPVFDPSVTEYTVSLPDGTASVNISAVPEDQDATVSDTGYFDVSWGSAVAKIKVAARDKTTTLTYTITFSVEGNYAINLPGGSGPASNVDISGLSLTSLPVTVEMWIKPEGSQIPYSGLFYHRGTADAGLQYAASWQQTDAIRLMTNSGDYGIYTDVVTPGKWHHLAMVVTDTSRTINLDGVITYEKIDLTAYDFSGGSLFLGWDMAVNDRAFKGLMDEVRVWKDAKTPEQVADDKYLALTGGETNLLAYWNFDDQAVNASDVTGNGFNGTINGGTYASSFVRTDTDGDGIPNFDDNCPEKANADQSDLDGDGIGDVCEDQMELEHAEAAQMGGFVNTGSVNNVAMNVLIGTINQANPLKLIGFGLSAANTTNLSDITGISVYASGLDPVFSTDSPVAVLEGIPADETVELDCDHILSEGNNYFWITLDISPEAAKNNVLNISCDSLILAGFDTITYIPDPVSPEACLVVNPDMFIGSAVLPVEVVTTKAPTYSDITHGANFASFQQNAIMTYNGFQYVTYWNSSKQVCISRKKMPAGAWEELVLTDYVTVHDLGDDHYTISMGICENDGTIHLAFDHHNDELNYRKSVDSLANIPDEIPWVKESFGGVTDELVARTKISNVTYPRFISKPDGDLMFECRLGWSGNGDDFLWKYYAETGTWDYVGEYLNGTSVGENAYINGVHYDPDGNMHVSWVWRQSPDAQTNHDIYYAYSNDDGRTWFNSSGIQVTELGTGPMTMSMEGLKVWTVSTNRGLINQESQAVDSKGGIHILQSYIGDDDVNTGFWDSRIKEGELHHIYQDGDGTWKNDIIAPSTRNRSEIAVDGNDNLYVVAPDYRIYFAAAADGWKTWTEFDVSQSGSTHNEGLIDREALLYNNLLSFVFTHSDNDGKIIVPYYLLERSGPGEGSGLNIMVFDDTEWDHPVSQELDSVNILAADINVTADSVSIRCHGILETRFAEAYTLYLTTSGPAKIWINENLVLETGDVSSSTEFQVPLQLVPSHDYPVKIEGVYPASSVNLILEWSSQKQAREIIPLSALYGELEDINSGVNPVLTDPCEAVQCYPNPFGTTFSLRARGHFVYKIHDAAGKLIASGTARDYCELGSMLGKGMYILTVSREGTVTNTKLIKQ